jgi:orotate phosphoribosyltransferase
MSSSQRLAEYQIEQVKGFILTECFHVGDFTLSNGEKSDYYIDCTPLVSTVVMRTQLARALHAMASHSLKNKKTRQPISYLGMETRGIPLAMCAAYHAGVMFGILRKEQKDHGMENIIEHYDAVVNGILFDDVITTGDTIKKSLEQAKMFRCHSIICIANRNDLKSINDVPVYSMLSQKEVIRMMQNRLYFHDETQKINTNNVTNP